MVLNTNVTLRVHSLIKVIFLTALLTITHVTYSKLNSQKEMKYMCKVIQSDKVKRAGANGTRGPMRGTFHDTNNNLNTVNQKTPNLKDAKKLGMAAAGSYN